MCHSVYIVHRVCSSSLARTSLTSTRKFTEWHVDSWHLPGLLLGQSRSNVQFWKFLLWRGYTKVSHETSVFPDNSAVGITANFRWFIHHILHSFVGSGRFVCCSRSSWSKYPKFWLIISSCWIGVLYCCCRLICRRCCCCWSIDRLCCCCQWIVRLWLCCQFFDHAADWLLGFRDAADGLVGFVVAVNGLAGFDGTTNRLVGFVQTADGLACFDCAADGLVGFDGAYNRLIGGLQ